MRATLREEYETHSCVMVEGLLAEQASNLQRWAEEIVFVSGVEL